MSKASEVVTALGRRGAALFGMYPWQRTRSFYEVFVAEFFLRRSNRTTVSRYLPSFLERFPNIDDLAAADPDDVVIAAHWAGLRTRTAALPAAARLLACRNRWDSLSLRDLPHVGPYAAGAIALYAFSEPNFPIDNNVRRILGRFFGAKTSEEIFNIANYVCEVAYESGGVEFVKRVHFGAIVHGWDTCKARPRCSECELITSCVSAVAVGIELEVLEGHRVATGL